jgi:RNA polymerase sigma factor (sigma-70 family)
LSGDGHIQHGQGERAGDGRIQGEGVSDVHGQGEGVSDVHGQGERAGEVRIEDLLRQLAPRVLGTLVRRHGQFDACEDAVQEALLAAALQWPTEGVPASPQAWLVTVAARRLVDEWRAESARRRREATVGILEPGGAVDPDGQNATQDQDDTLTLLFLCCHPSLSAPSQLALTLRAVGGLTTAEIATAFLVPEATMAQRISRAKQRIKTGGVGFELPPDADRAERLRVVLHVLYLVFNEGYTTSSGPALQRTDLTTEAIRLTRLLQQLVPGDGEVAGLLALMLLTDARRAARTSADGSLVPLDEQRRELWNAAQIEEGVALLTRTLGRLPGGPYQLQAAIAAVHDEAPNAQATDWPQILALYDILEQLSPGPVVTLNRAVAVAMVNGPRAGLDVLDGLDDDERMAQTHRLPAVRGHLLELAGDAAGAREAYQRAARMTASIPEQRYLALRAARLG